MQISATKKISNLLVFLLLLQCSYQQCCTKLEGKKCIQCPEGTHLYRSNCLFNIDNCTEYTNGFDCQKCISGFQVKQLVSGDTFCEKTPQQEKQFTDRFLTEQEKKTNEKYIFTDDFLRTRYLEIRSSAIVRAISRLFKNGTQFIVIDYQHPNKTELLFRGILEPNIITFIFKFVSFEEMTRLEAEKQISTPPKKQEPPKQTPKNPNSTSQPGSGGMKEQPPKNLTEEPKKEGNNTAFFQQISQGFNRIAADSIKSDETIARIDQFLRVQNKSQLQKTNLAAVFQTQVGISLQYKLYYVNSQDSKRIYQAFVTYHLFTKRINVVSFAPLFFY